MEGIQRLSSTASAHTASVRGTGNLSGQPEDTAGAGAVTAAAGQPDVVPAGQFHEISDDVGAPSAVAVADLDAAFEARTSAPASYQVKPGDSLWMIAQRLLGDGRRWHEVYVLNRDRIHNPDLIYPGQTLKLPSNAGGPGDAPGVAHPQHSHGNGPGGSHHRPTKGPGGPGHPQQGPGGTSHHHGQDPGGTGTNPPPGGGSSDNPLPLPPGVTASEAADFAQHADALWIQARHYRDPSASYQTDDANYWDVNVNHDGSRARKLMDEQAPMIARFVAQLPPDERAHYQQIQRETAHDPEARLALEVLLVKGRLTNAPKNAGGDSLLAALDKVATQAVEPPIDRTQMLSDMIQEIAQPAAIAQHAYGTCTVTSVEIKTALENPAEYARIVGGLASPEGKVKLADGEVAHRYPGTQYPAAGDRRSISAHLWQPAMMVFGGNRSYRNSASDVSGLSPTGVEHVLDAINGTRSRLYECDGGTHQAIERTVTAIEQATRKGESVPCSLQWGAGGHKILVTGIHGDTVDYINPWGIECHMSLEHFRNNLHAANVADFDHDLISIESP